MKYTDVIARVPEGSSGAAKIVHDTPTGIDRIRGSMEGKPLTREKYARLLINGYAIMTDAEFERATNTAIFKARGDALVAGLGIGLVLDPMSEQCSSLTVVEKSPDVIALVAPSFPKCRIVEADIYEWEPEKGSKYDFIYFDIWGDFNADMVNDADRLEAKFRKRLRKGGMMRSWVKTAIRASGRYL